MRTRPPPYIIGPTGFIAIAPTMQRVNSSLDGLQRTNNTNVLVFDALSYPVDPPPRVSWLSSIPRLARLALSVLHREVDAFPNYCCLPRATWLVCSCLGHVLHCRGDWAEEPVHMPETFKFLHKNAMVASGQTAWYHMGRACDARLVRWVYMPVARTDSIRRHVRRRSRFHRYTYDTRPIHTSHRHGKQTDTR